MVGGSQRLLSPNPTTVLIVLYCGWDVTTTTVLVVLLLGLLLGCDNIKGFYKGKVSKKLKIMEEVIFRNIPENKKLFSRVVWKIRSYFTE